MLPKIISIASGNADEVDLSSSLWARSVEH